MCFEFPFNLICQMNNGLFIRPTMARTQILVYTSSETQVPEKHKFSGTNQKPERRRPFGTGLVRHCPQGLFSPLFNFLLFHIFRLFRQSLAPTMCPWVSENVVYRRGPETGISALVCIRTRCSVSSMALFTTLAGNCRRNLLGVERP